MAKKKKVDEKEKATKKPSTKKKEKSPRFKIGSLGYLGGVAILSIQEVTIHNRKYNNVTRIDGVGYLLSDKDLKAQVKAKL